MSSRSKDTVRLDGAPVCSCMTFARDAVGGAIGTVEGLARGGALRPVQQAFIERGAASCRVDDRVERRPLALDRRRAPPGAGALPARRGGRPRVPDARRTACGGLPFALATHAERMQHPKPSLLDLGDLMTVGSVSELLGVSTCPLHRRDRVERARA
ncbi:hypothetical protein WMF04_27615 [Sorangium sp. So ce260]|uniref:hypothetical protein n=1 Tax=Sorangium sp. So ce260 TaxID=3133291 RepID=UPI003F62C9F2